MSETYCTLVLLQVFTNCKVIATHYTIKYKNIIRIILNTIAIALLKLVILPQKISTVCMYGRAVQLSVVSIDIITKLSKTGLLRPSKGTK